MPEPLPIPAPAPNVLEQTASGFDNLLLDIVTNGQEVTTEEGDTQRVQPTAAMLNVIRQRLKDAGISGTDPNSRDKGLGGVFNHLNKLRLAGGGKLPEVSEEEDE